MKRLWARDSHFLFFACKDPFFIATSIHGSFLDITKIKQRTIAQKTRQ